MTPLTHVIVGAVSALAPDAALSLFFWRNQWLPESHTLRRLQRFLHSPTGLWVVWCVGYTTHVVLDWFSKHKENPHER